MERNSILKTPESRVLENITVAQLVTKFHAIHGTHCLELSRNHYHHHHHRRRRLQGLGLMACSDSEFNVSEFTNLWTFGI